MLYIVGRVLINLLTPGKSEVFYIFKKYEPSACGDRVTSVYLGQYDDCWCPGSSSRQDISSHDIHYIEYVGPYLTWGRILSTCVISRWRNDTRWRKYMFMFPLKNLAHKELTAIRHETRSHYLTQCWSTSMVTFVVNRPQWVNPSGTETNIINARSKLTLASPGHQQWSYHSLVLSHWSWPLFPFPCSMIYVLVSSS